MVREDSFFLAVSLFTKKSIVRKSFVSYKIFHTRKKTLRNLKNRIDRSENSIILQKKFDYCRKFFKKRRTYASFSRTLQPLFLLPHSLSKIPWPEFLLPWRDHSTSSNRFLQLRASSGICLSKCPLFSSKYPAENSFLHSPSCTSFQNPGKRGDRDFFFPHVCRTFILPAPKGRCAAKKKALFEDALFLCGKKKEKKME